ncbi:hypothetical protein CB1_000728009 [Camelus ferus]|nr:hypothetical protein CB1_000728009 [Camelus ferus]
MNPEMSAESRPCDLGVEQVIRNEEIKGLSSEKECSKFETLRCENETKFKTEEVFWAYNFCPTPYSWTALLGLILYLVFFAPGAFFLYAGFAAVGLLFIYGCLPETKGKKLEEIESLFDNRLCTCGASDSDEGRYIEYIRVKGSNYHLSDNDASDVE